MPQSYYDYKPVEAAAIVFAVLYTITFLITAFQYFAFRSWFWIFMVIASLMESMGYIARIISVRSPLEQIPYIISFLPIFLAPAVIAASCYMALGRLILHVTPPKHLKIRTLWVTPRWMTPIFVCCDFIAFLIQLWGGVRSATSDNPSSKQAGFNIAKIGLALQLVCFGLFLVISVRFHLVARCFRESWPDAQWPKFLWAINISATLIFVRSIYRMIEFSTGFDGYLATHEWNFYVFEAALILPVFVLFNVFHPARFVSNVGWRQKRVTDEELPSRPESAMEMNARTSNVQPSKSSHLIR